MARVVVCIVTNGRPDVTLSCAISLLRMQTLSVSADLHFVATLDDALNALWTRGADAAGALIVEGSVGFDANFLARAVRSPHGVVVGSYPLPGVDWERVQTQPAGEAPARWGNVYSARPRPGARPVDGYVEVEDARLGLAWVSREALERVVREHPDILSRDGGYAAFATAGVHDGQRVSAAERFLRLYGRAVVADLEAPATACGQMEFGGCVGARSILR